MRPARWLAVLLAMGAAAGAGGARADQRCASYTWNVAREPASVAHERALFATHARTQAAGRDPDSAPRISVDRLYRLTLAPQERVTFAAAPGKAALTDGAYAGLVRVQLPAAGVYRVSIDRPFWVDLVKAGSLIASTDFTGSRGCGAPHKIVQYRLPAGSVLLQLSGEVSREVEVTVTRAPASAASAARSTHTPPGTQSPTGPASTPEH